LQSISVISEEGAFELELAKQGDLPNPPGAA
jgi:hypothetical protein